MIHPEISLLAVSELYREADRDGQTGPMIGETAAYNGSILAAMLGFGTVMLITGLWWLATSL